MPWAWHSSVPACNFIIIILKKNLGVWNKKELILYCIENFRKSACKSNSCLLKNKKKYIPCVTFFKHHIHTHSKCLYPWHFLRSWAGGLKLSTPAPCKKCAKKQLVWYGPEVRRMTVKLLSFEIWWCQPTGFEVGPSEQIRLLNIRLMEKLINPLVHWETK